MDTEEIEITPSSRVVIKGNQFWLYVMMPWGGDDDLIEVFAETGHYTNPDREPLIGYCKKVVEGFQNTGENPL